MLSVLFCKQLVAFCGCVCFGVSAQTAPLCLFYICLFQLRNYVSLQARQSHNRTRQIVNVPYKKSDTVCLGPLWIGLTQAYNFVYNSVAYISTWPRREQRTIKRKTSYFMCTIWPKCFLFDIVYI